MVTKWSQTLQVRVLLGVPLLLVTKLTLLMGFKSCSTFIWVCRCGDYFPASKLWSQTPGSQF